MKRCLLVASTVALSFLAAAPIVASEMVFEMFTIGKGGKESAVGTLTISETPYGVLVEPALKGVVNAHGLHGFHVHEFPDCGPGEKNGDTVPGLAAGGHYDPQGTGRHSGPYGTGHLGDLPALYIDSEGNGTTPVLAPRLKSSDFKGRSVIIHSGGDNYSDDPSPLGGGGSRMLCGVERP
jgi:Cu-Zn family superoxide dismutase